MDTPWISAYEPKEWQIYEMFLSETGELKTLKESMRLLGEDELFVCGGESEYTADKWKRTNSVDKLLFYDIEQIWAMNFDKVYGVSEVGVLIKEWRGHPEDSLVLVLYKGVDKEPRFLTVGVTKIKS